MLEEPFCMGNFTVVKVIVRFGDSLRRILEAANGIEPLMKVLQTFALPLGYAALG